jgi:hypothetical protein
VELAAQSLPWPQVPKFLYQMSRLDLLLPLSGTAIIIAIAAFAGRLRTGRWHAAFRAPHQTGVVLAALLVFVAVALTGGRVQPISFYRYASFAIPLMLVGSVSLWGLPFTDGNSRLARLVADRRAPGVIFALCLVTIAVQTHPARFYTTLLPRAGRFATGAISIDTAYTLQPPVPYASSGIYPGARGAYAIVGPDTPIWSFHHFSTYCMLPGCLIESFEEFLLPRWPELMFGAPEQGRAALQAAGLNYFLFSRELPIVDSMPLSPLLSPDVIGHYFGIRWTDGTTALLTWLGPGVQPIDQTWLDDYRRAVEQSKMLREFPYDDMKKIFARLDSTPHPWRPFTLPWP